MQCSGFAQNSVLSKVGILYETVAFVFENHISADLSQKCVPLVIETLTFSKVIVSPQQNNPFFHHRKKGCSLLYRLHTIRFLMKRHHSETPFYKPHKKGSHYGTVWSLCPKPTLSLESEHHFYRHRKKGQTA